MAVFDWLEVEGSRRVAQSGRSGGGENRAAVQVFYS